METGNIATATILRVFSGVVEDANRYVRQEWYKNTTIIGSKMQMEGATTKEAFSRALTYY